MCSLSCVGAHWCRLLSLNLCSLSTVPLLLSNDTWVPLELVHCVIHLYVHSLLVLCMHLVNGSSVMAAVWVQCVHCLCTVCTCMCVLMLTMLCIPRHVELWYLVDTNVRILCLKMLMWRAMCEAWNRTSMADEDDIVHVRVTVCW